MAIYFSLPPSPESSRDELHTEGKLERLEVSFVFVHLEVSFYDYTFSFAGFLIYDRAVRPARIRGTQDGGDAEALASVLCVDRLIHFDVRPGSD